MKKTHQGGWRWRLLLIYSLGRWPNECSSSSSSRRRVNLLVKYGGGPSMRRSLATIRHVRNRDGAARRRKEEQWRSRVAAMKTISQSRHVAIVEVDLDDDDGSEDIVNEVRRGLITNDDVVLVEEDFLMYKYNYYSNSTSFGETVGLAEEDLMLNLGGHATDELLSLMDHSSNSSSRRSNGANFIDFVEFQQYGIQITQVSEVWRLTNSHPNKYINAPVKICVIDSGYDSSHEDLPKNNITTTNTGYGNPLTDVDGHGTHVAGIIGAVGNNDLGIVGVNPNPTKFTFHISKALNDDGLGTASSVLVGIEGCISSGSKIISMSLGGGPSSSEIFREIYEDAYNQGVLLFAASGNLGLYVDDYPASYPTVVSVGAVGMDSRRANFSNWNTQLELMGPGVDIVSTYPGDRYGALSGTSMAVPYVAGIAALIWGYFPQCSNQQIRNVLAVTAKAMTSRRRCNHKTGYGLVQAKNAFDLLDKYGCDAGGQNYIPPSAGGVGGCSQQIAHMQQKSNRDSVGDRCQQLTLRLLTDNYAYETSWQLIDGRNEVLDVGPNGEGKLKKNTEYSGPVGGCLEPGTYNFTINDMFGDGLDEPGSYTIILNDVVFETKPNFGFYETTTFVVSNSVEAGASQPIWYSIMYEAFDNGFGAFISGGLDAVYTARKFGRSGLVMIKHGINNCNDASISSRNVFLSDHGGFKKFKVVFSFYASNLEEKDGFCLDYQTNEATTWSKANCWLQLETGKWNDDVDWVFEPGDSTLLTSVRIRFRGFSSNNMNRVFIDKIDLFGRKK